MVLTMSENCATELTQLTDVIKSITTYTRITMNTYTPEQLKKILDDHKLWLETRFSFNPQGSPANLMGANLSHANLRGTNLIGSNLMGSNLSRANLSEINKDFISKLELQKNEVVGLFKEVVDGKIDGSTYTGDCACFVGTLANVKGIHYTNLTVRPHADSPTEKFFIAIRKGDTPETNKVSAIVADWITEFLLDNNMEVPVRTVTWDR